MDFRNTAGKKVSPPKNNKYNWRPAVYGVLIKNNKLLFIQPCWDKKFSLPGGSMNLGEDPRTSLKREFLEETGNKVDVGKNPLFVDTHLYGNPDKNQYFQRISLYYKVKLISKTNKNIDEETTEIIWKELKKLKPNDFTYFQQNFLKTLL
tara:strand:+ start:180 stop:629 length:450 start_codon:yes stop_codon:yes gene_type:complete